MPARAETHAMRTESSIRKVAARRENLITRRGLEGIGLSNGAIARRVRVLPLRWEDTRPEREAQTVSCVRHALAHGPRAI
jgi:hypothetical protein